jgi:hypothetical protein
MHSLPSVIPNADDLLALPVEDLGAVLLKIAVAKMQTAGFIYEVVTEITIGSGMAAYRDSGYPPHKKAAYRCPPGPCLELAGAIQPDRTVARYERPQRLAGLYR